MKDPFEPLTAKPKTEEDRIKLRLKDAAAHGGKTHRGKAKTTRFLFGYKTNKVRKDG